MQEQPAQKPNVATPAFHHNLALDESQQRRRKLARHFVAIRYIDLSLLSYRTSAPGVTTGCHRLSAYTAVITVPVDRMSWVV
jgi:hypothetical protein